MQKKELHEIYKKLKNKEKQAWSNKLGYADVSSLRKYLTTNECEVPQKVIDSLLDILEANRLNEVEFNKIGYMEQLKDKLIKCILESDNIEELDKIKEDISIACESQVKRISLTEKMYK